MDKRREGKRQGKFSIGPWDHAQILQAHSQHHLKDKTLLSYPCFYEPRTSSFITEDVPKIFGLLFLGIKTQREQSVFLFQSKSPTP